MRRIFSVIAATAALLVLRAYAEETPIAATATVAAPTPAASPAASPTAAGREDTHVEGQIPDSLAGTWLMISSAKAKGKNQLYSNQSSIYKIAKLDGVWTVRQLAGNVAPELTEALGQANKAGQVLKPSAAVLKATSEGVPQLRSPEALVRADRYTLSAPGHLPGKPAQPESSCKILISLVSGGVNVKTVEGDYCFTDVQPNVLSGSLHIAMVTLRPPLPISIEGLVAMYRLP